MNIYFNHSIIHCGDPVLAELKKRFFSYSNRRLISISSCHSFQLWYYCYEFNEEKRNCLDWWRKHKSKKINRPNLEKSLEEDKEESVFLLFLCFVFLHYCICSSPKVSWERCSFLSRINPKFIIPKIETLQKSTMKITYKNE